jgi:hypothetical protein
MTQIPLLTIPLKLSQDLDFHELGDYLAQEGHDVSYYSSNISQFTQLRRQARTPEKGVSGRNILIKYYGQFELLCLRFPIDQERLKINFEWLDAFSSSKVAQNSSAFEKASILFNIGAMCSYIASYSDRKTQDGLKSAFNYFQVAAGQFHFINENFLHTPSTDLSRESIRVLEDLMLCQAQECFIEKALLDQKNGLLISRLAIQVASMYSNIKEAMEAIELKNQFESSWKDLLKVSFVFIGS